MADSLIGSTETTAVSNDKIANLVQSYLIQESKLLPLVSDYSYLVAQGDKSVSLPKSGGFTVVDKSENVAIDAESITYSADAIQLIVHRAVQFLLEKFASRQAAPAVLSDMLMKASKDMALDIDKIIAAAMLSGTAVANTIDFNDGVNDDLELADILNIRAIFQSVNLNPSECFIGLHPAKEKEMLALDNFIDASKYGGSEAIRDGEVGKVYGMRVIVSNVFENDSVLAWHPSACGFAFAQKMVVGSQADLANLADRYSLDFICGVNGGLDSGVRSALVAPVA